MSDAEPGARRARGRRPRGAARPPALLVERLGPPISTVGWSPALVVQSLEMLPIGVRDGALFWLQPVHADSLRVGLAPSAAPGDVVLATLRWYPLAPRVAHSTSWRYGEGRVILTYAVVVDPPGELPAGTLAERPIARADLARGEALAPPPAIGVAAVLEHALRHLSWLLRDDPAIATALPGWERVLDAYQPEPFRALG
jgi:hypothetical protein